MASDPPEHFSFVDLEPIEEPVPVVVKRFRKMLPLAAAASQESGLASAPSASAQESPASLRSAPASNDVARELPFADLRPEASHSVPLPGPLDVIARLPEGSRSSFERPVLRDASGALPRPVLSALKEPSSTSSSAPLPRPSFAPASKKDKGPAHRLEVALPPSLPGVGLCLSCRPNRQHLMRSGPLRWPVARVPLRLQPRLLLCPSLPFAPRRVPWKRNGCRSAAFGVGLRHVQR